MRLSVVEGCLYAIAVGFGELYFVADAVRAGASPILAGLVATLPLWLGAVGPLLVLWMLGRGVRRRSIVVLAVLAQTTVLGLLAWSCAQPTHTAIIVLVSAAAYQVTGQAAGTAWSSWYGDLVPPAVRGRYFALRNRMVHLCTCLGLAAAGSVLAHVEPDTLTNTGGTGFRLVFTIAALARLGSAMLLLASPEPPPPEFPRVREAAQFFCRPESLSVRRIFVVAASLQLSVYIASPFFAPYMLEVLVLDYFEYTLASLAAVMLKFLVLPAWGKIIDQHGARPVYTFAGVLIAIIPVPWLFVGNPAGVVAAQAFSGLSWGAHELGQFSLLLETAPANRRPHVFAALNVCSGTAQILGTAVGALTMWATDDAYMMVFALTIVTRGIVAAWMPRALPVVTERAPIARKHMLLRILGVRPSGGIGHRPMFVDVGTDAEPGKPTQGDAALAGRSPADVATE